MQTTTTVAVVAVMALAGCSGALTGTPSPSSPTGDAVTEEKSPESTTQAQSTPNTVTEERGSEDTTQARLTPDAIPGVSDEQLTNESALLAAHADALESSGFVYRLSTRTASRSNGSGPDPARTVRRIRAEAGGAPYRILFRQSGGVTSDQVRRMWGNESLSVVNATTVRPTGNETTLETQGPVTSATLSTAALPDFVTPGEWSVAGTENGNVVFTADEFNESAISVNASGYEGRLVVTEAGVIVNATVGITGQRGSGDDAVRFVLAVSYDLESTEAVSVSRPGWVDDALSESAQSRPAVTAEDDYAAITNTGDEAIPSGSIVSIVKDGSGP